MSARSPIARPLAVQSPAARPFPSCPVASPPVFFCRRLRFLVRCIYMYMQHAAARPIRHRLRIHVYATCVVGRCLMSYAYTCIRKRQADGGVRANGTVGLPSVRRRPQSSAAVCCLSAPSAAADVCSVNLLQNVLVGTACAVRSVTVLQKVRWGRLFGVRSVNPLQKVRGEVLFNVRSVTDLQNVPRSASFEVRSVTVLQKVLEVRRGSGASGERCVGEAGGVDHAHDRRRPPVRRKVFGHI